MSHLLGTYQGEYLKGRYHGRGKWIGNLSYLGLKPPAGSKTTVSTTTDNNNENNNNNDEQKICIYEGHVLQMFKRVLYVTSSTFSRALLTSSINPIIFYFKIS